MSQFPKQCPPVDRSAFTAFRFPPEVIMLAVRWYLRYGLSYRDVEELLTDRGIEVDHVTIHRWVQRFIPLLIDAARPRRHSVGGRSFVDETYVKVAGKWRSVYRAVDEHGQVIDVYVSRRRDLVSARTFFRTALDAHGEPNEVITDLAQALETVIEEPIPTLSTTPSNTPKIVTSAITDRKRARRSNNATKPGQVIDVFVSPRRNIDKARAFFKSAFDALGEPEGVVTDLAPGPRNRDQKAVT